MRLIQILADNHVKYETYTINADLEEHLSVLSKQKSIPQLYIGGEYVGNCEDIHKLNENGNL